jgi:hypothetical protein
MYANESRERSGAAPSQRVEPTFSKTEHWRKHPDSGLEREVGWQDQIRYDGLADRLMPGEKLLLSYIAGGRKARKS